MSINSDIRKLLFQFTVCTVLSLTYLDGKKIILFTPILVNERCRYLTMKRVKAKITLRDRVKMEKNKNRGDFGILGIILCFMELLSQMGLL